MDATRRLRGQGYQQACPPLATETRPSCTLGRVGSHSAIQPIGRGARTSQRGLTDAVGSPSRMVKSDDNQAAPILGGGIAVRLPLRQR
jgi:hypothetical protein